MTKARDTANLVATGVPNSLITLDAAEIPNISTDKLTSGTLPDARIADLAATKLTGTIADARISASSVNQHASDYIAWQSVVTASTLTAVAGRGYPINTTSNACTITLPASASVGDTIKFVDYARNWGTNALTLTSALNFQGSSSIDPIYNTNGQAVTITYVDVTKGWLPTVDDDVTNEAQTFYSLEYLVVAGGGAGGGSHRGGGGGAGGYRNSYASETSGRNSSSETDWTIGSGTVITVTVGAGGATSSGNGGTGGVSTISASGQTTITSNGGGGGGEYQAAADAGTYGSGAGGGHSDSTVYAGSDGTAGQGFDGGSSGVANATPQGGSGGGAGANGQNGGTTSATAGGVGLSSSITGSAVFRAGGGGAGSYNTGGYSSGGNGGGGNGASNDASDPHSGVADGSYYYPVSGTDNTGGGGGGMAGGGNTTTYGRGGSGVIILRVPLANYSGTTTGSPTATTDGSFKVIVFNASGSYTA